LAYEIRNTGLVVAQRRGLTVTYAGTAAGEYFVDLLVEESFLIESITVKTLQKAYRSQCINYLKASNLPLCLLPNFHIPRLEIRRVANRLQSIPLHLRAFACILRNLR
jgi:GxxExxY protein